MKTILKISIMLVSILLLQSFSAKPGGEGFEIFLNNKPVVQQYGTDMNDIKTIQLNRDLANNKMTLKYYHCGRSGKNRIVEIRNDQNKTINIYHYPDTTPITAMEVPLNEIIKVKTATNFKLFYSSSELPKGRVLASLRI